MNIIKSGKSSYSSRYWEYESQIGSELSVYGILAAVNLIYDFISCECVTDKVCLSCLRVSWNVLAKEHVSIQVRRTSAVFAIKVYEIQTNTESERSLEIPR